MTWRGHQENVLTAHSLMEVCLSLSLGRTANRPALSPSLPPTAVGECASLMGNDVRRSLCELGTSLGSARAVPTP